MFNLENKTLVITGATVGLGSELINSLKNQYDSLQIIVLDLPDRIEQCTLLNDIHYISLDLRDIKSIKSAFMKIKNEYSIIDILINNAGINKLAPALNVSEKTWDEIVNVNMKGTFFVCKEAFPCLIKSEHASIINIASQFSVVGGKYRAPYAASKAGIVALTKVLALEWSVYGIRVNAISPTVCKKQNNQVLLDIDSIKKAYLDEIPMGRFCQPNDILGVVIFLASNSSEMITGHNLIIDGGWTIK